MSRGPSTALGMTSGQRCAELSVANRWAALENQKFFCGVLAQLVERLNGIEEVRGSIPLGSSLRLPPEATRRLSRRSLGEGGPGRYGAARLAVPATGGRGRAHLEMEAVAAENVQSRLQTRRRR